MIIFVCLLWKFFIFDILGALRDGSGWLLATSSPSPSEENLRRGRQGQRPALTLSLRAWEPGVQAFLPGVASAFLAWASASALDQKLGCQWGPFLGEDQGVPLGLLAEERVVFRRFWRSPRFWAHH